MFLTAVTHGHVDHVGATPALAAAYPDMQVVMHVDELPYVLGRHSQSCSGGCTLTLRLWLHGHAVLGLLRWMSPVCCRQEKLPGCTRDRISRLFVCAFNNRRQR